MSTTKDDAELLGGVIASQAKLEKSLKELQARNEAFEARVLEYVCDMKRMTREAIDESLKVGATINRLSCMQEPTGPQCPISIRERELMEAGDDEPASVVTRNLSVKAGPFRASGPSIMVVLVSAILTAAVVSWAWIRFHLSK